MSLILAKSPSSPVIVKGWPTVSRTPRGRVTVGAPLTVDVGQYTLSMDDFLEATKYVLTTMDLEPKDPRVSFVKFVKQIKKVKGRNEGKTRLSHPEERF